MNKDSKRRIIKRPVLVFFIMAYAWSWSWWLPVVFTLKEQGANPNYIPSWIVPFVLIGAYGPTITSIFLTAYTEGGSGLKRLFARFTKWRAPALVHLIIWLGTPAFLVIAMLLSPDSTSLLGQPDWSQLQLIPMVLSSGLVFGPLAEELGWRGFALPKLQKRYSALTSSLIIGVLWCFWHTPLFWSPGGTLVSGQEVTLIAIAKYLLYACGLSVIFTWIFNRSRGSVLLPVAFHAMMNANIPFLIFPNRDANAALAINWVSIIPVWAFALLLIGVYGKTHLNKGPRVI